MLNDILQRGIVYDKQVIDIYCDIDLWIEFAWFSNEQLRRLQHTKWETYSFRTLEPILFG